MLKLGSPLHWATPKAVTLDRGVQVLHFECAHCVADGEEAEALSRWSLDIHTIVSGETRGPHVYLLQRRPLRRSKRTREASVDKGEEDLRVRLHVHET